MMINNLKLFLPKTFLAIDVTRQMPICPKLNKENKTKPIVHIKINYLKQYFFKILNKRDNEHIKKLAPSAGRAVTFKILTSL